MAGSKTKLIVSDAARVIKGMPRGEFLSHAALAHLLDSDYDSNIYRGRMNDLIETLKADSIFLKNDFGRGYKISDRGHEIDVVVSEFNKGIRGLGRANRHKDCIEIELITDNILRAQTVERQNWIGNFAAFLKAGKAVYALDAPKEPKE